MIEPLCIKCNFPKHEHSYNGTCYGVCGEFLLGVPQDWGHPMKIDPEIFKMRANSKKETDDNNS